MNCNEAMVISSKLIRSLQDDNSCYFNPSNETCTSLYECVSKIDINLFTQENIVEMTSGEESEVFAKFKDVPGWIELNHILNGIFNGPILQ